MRLRYLFAFGAVWAALGVLRAAIPASAVINEFNEKPEDTHELEEFIELYNPGDSDLPMSGWTLTNAVSYTFPASAVLPSHGYLVVALSPAAIQTRYGFTPLGPWSGKLSSDGESITLKDAGGVTRDVVTYGVGFPWPSAIDGQGQSAELIHPGLDNSLPGSWRASNGPPTPGAANSTAVALTAAPPDIEQVAHAPQQPASGEAVTITAKVTDPDGVASVALSYQLVDPGAYIRPSDPLYATSWTTVPMNDSGAAGDALAGDSIYTALLPASLQTNRRLVRYRITATDALGNSQMVPYADDAQKNFAYYVYDGLPAWQGALRPGTTPLQTFSAATLGSAPVYTLIANNQDVYDSQYAPADLEVKLPGTLVYDGVVYDNIQYGIRGQNSFYQAGKNKWRFDFNPGRDFKAKDNLGKPYAETWGSFDANACASPWIPANRGMAGVEESVGFKIFQLAGGLAPSTHYYQFRVVRNAVETPPAGTLTDDLFSWEGAADGQYFGDFWGLYMAIEPLKGNFLDERGLPDGNIYKAEDGAGNPSHLLPGFPGDASDYNSYEDTVENTDPTEAWWRANLDLDAYYTFAALNRLIGNVDLRAGDNHYFYHRSSDDRWVVIPWDLDLGFVPKSHQTTLIDDVAYPGVIPTQKALIQQPALALEYRNRAREILDLMASDNSPSGGQIGQLIDEFAQIVAPTGTTDNLANADAAMWNLHPRTQGVDGEHFGSSNHKGSFFYTPTQVSMIGGDYTRWLRSPDTTGVTSHADMMGYLRDYSTDAWPGGVWAVNNGNQLGYGFQYLKSEAADAAIPATPVLTYTGGTGYPVDEQSFSASAFSGSALYGATQWRISEISAPGISGYVAGTPRKYEIESGWSATGPGTRIFVPPAATTVGKTYRARVRYQDATGLWSHWSAPVQFTASISRQTLVDYWNFNNASSLATLLTTTKGDGTLAISLGPLAGATYLADTGKDFAASNAQNGDAALTHLRVNNPLGTVLTFSLPTTGYESIVAAVEARRSSSDTAAELEEWSYTIDGFTWIPRSTLSADPDTPRILTFDFREITGANDNANFALKVEFAQGSGGTAGNHRFDDFTLTGDLIAGSYASWVKSVFNASQQADVSISGVDADPDGDGLSNLLEFALSTQPLVKDQPALSAALTTVNGVSDPALRFRRPSGISGVVYSVLASDDLLTWTLVPSQIVSVTAESDGTEEVLLAALVSASGPHRFLSLQVEAAADLPALGTYERWATSSFDVKQMSDPSISGKDADPDGDGVPNVLEFALGTQPLAVGGSPAAFTWVVDGDVTYAGLQFVRPQGGAGVSYELLATDGDGIWSVVANEPFSSDALGDGTERVIFKDSAPKGSTPRMLSLRVDSN